MKNHIIAIDGHAAAGKGTIARAIAKHLNYTYIDTGAMYRVIALLAGRNNLLISTGENEAKLDEKGLQKILPNTRIEFKIVSTDSREQYICLNGLSVEEEIRAPDMSFLASYISKFPFVREFTVELQREMVQRKNIVMDGRDIGTVVFPDAVVKLFITASITERAKRRHKELLNRGFDIHLKKVRNDIIIRDKQDVERELSPLFQAPDAILFDTTNHTYNSQLREAIKIIEEIIN